MKSRRVLIKLSIATFILFILLWMMLPKFLAPQNINLPKYFPDPELRKAVAISLGKDMDEFFTSDDTKSFEGEIRVIQCEKLNGLEYFPNLSKIFINSDTIEDIDLIMQTELKEISIVAANIVNVNTNNCPKLINFSLSVNTPKRTVNKQCRIDFFNNSKLQSLTLLSTDITELDLSHCPDLINFVMENTFFEKMQGLKSIDFSFNKNLKFLMIHDQPQLDKIDISMLHGLEVFSCMRNNIINLNVSQNQKIKSLFVALNPIKHIDFPLNIEYENLTLSMRNLDDDTLSVLKKQNIYYKSVDGYR